jgi:hypothetical protein
MDTVSVTVQFPRDLLAALNLSQWKLLNGLLYSYF